MTRLIFKLLWTLAQLLGEIAGLVWLATAVYWVWAYPAKVEFIWRWMWS